MSEAYWYWTNFDGNIKIGVAKQYFALGRYYMRNICQIASFDLCYYTAGVILICFAMLMPLLTPATVIHHYLLACRFMMYSTLLVKTLIPGYLLKLLHILFSSKLNILFYLNLFNCHGLQFEVIKYLIVFSIIIYYKSF